MTWTSVWRWAFSCRALIASCKEGIFTLFIFSSIVSNNFFICSLVGSIFPLFRTFHRSGDFAVRSFLYFCDYEVIFQRTSPLHDFTKSLEALNQPASNGLFLVFHGFYLVVASVNFKPLQKQLRAIIDNGIPFKRPVKPVFCRVIYIQLP